MTSTNILTGKKGVLQGFWGEISNFSLLVSELVWSSSLFAILFNRRADHFIIFFSFFIFGFLSYFFSLSLEYFHLNKTWIRVAVGIWCSAAAILWLQWIVFPGDRLDLWQIISRPFIAMAEQPYYQSELWQLLFFLLLLWRGITLPTSAVNSWRAVRSSQLGFLMFLFYGLSTAWDDFAANLAPFLFYLFFLLIALCTARLAELSINYGGKTPAFTRSWLAWAVSFSIFLIGIGTLIGWLTGVVYVEFTSLIVTSLYYVLIAVVMIILSPIILLILVLMPFFYNLIHQLISANLGKDQFDFFQKIIQPNPINTAKVINTLNRGITLILILSVLLVLFAVIIGYRFRMRRKRQGTDAEINELAAVKDYLKGRNQRKPFFQSALEQARQWLAAARIRRIYAQMMTYCAGLDAARPQFMTPLEFIPQLRSIFPDQSEAAEQLTHAYIKIRYGEYPETIAEMRSIYEIWEKFKPYAEELLKERKKRIRKK